MALLLRKVVTGFLINNLWSYAGESGRADVNAMTLQPFFNYNLPKGWYLTTSPIITANWEAPSDERWTIPSVAASVASSSSVVSRSTPKSITTVMSRDQT